MNATPPLTNDFFLSNGPHNPGGDAWRGALTGVLQLYKPGVGEQGWGLIADYNFDILDRAMLRDHAQVISGVNEFTNRVSVRRPRAADEAVPLADLEREVRLWAMLRR